MILFYFYQKITHEVEDSESDEDSDDDENNKKESIFFNRTFAEDKNLPFNFRERRHVLNSSRIDSIISNGLSISKK